jgi:hypothetical protein
MLECAPLLSLPGGVTVARLALDQLVEVRILAGQPSPSNGALSSRGLGRVVLSHQTGVRIPVALPILERPWTRVRGRLACVATGAAAARGRARELTPDRGSRHGAPGCPRRAVRSHPAPIRGWPPAPCAVPRQTAGRLGGAGGPADGTIGADPPASAGAGLQVARTGTPNAFEAHGLTLRPTLPSIRHDEAPLGVTRLQREGGPLPDPGAVGLRKSARTA